MADGLRVALVAGEASGDILGSGLMQALRARHPDIEFIGVGGPRMEAEGLSSYFPMERLSVMGLVEVLGRLPELLRRRKRLIRTLIEARPDVMIGIDAPDFTLGVEHKLRQAGLRTVHYVSPSVWAWRQKRVLKIREACDLMLALFPFEARFYEEHGVPVRFVLPCASAARREQIEQMLQGREPLPLTLLDGASHEALAACDAVLIASGTATLEALLYKRPMVVAYRVAGLTYRILKRLVKSPYISLPNLLAGRLLVPELIQDAATPQALAATLSPLLDDGSQQVEFFDAIHRALRQDASAQAAEAVLQLVERR
ncbi:lipid-A-disaccharide synthase [Pseudomonas aeruginosa]|nr:lipid-A-disaccharide synthase [Pseudomonas aeruginosa]